MDHAPLTPLEAMITDVIGVHPEYQAIVADADAALALSRAERAAQKILFYIWVCISPCATKCQSIGRPACGSCTACCKTGMGTRIAPSMR